MTPTQRAIQASRECTFHRSTNSDATVICIICAARIINEAVADAAERVREILAHDNMTGASEAKRVAEMFKREARS